MTRARVSWKKSRVVELASRGLRWGRLLSDVATARTLIAGVQCDMDLLPDADKKLLRTAYEHVDALNQRVWEVQQTTWKKLRGGRGG